MQLLICSPNKKHLQQIFELASPLSFSITITSSIAEAERNFSSNNFDYSLIDIVFGVGPASELLLNGWKHNQLMLGAIFDLDYHTADPWRAKLSGVEILDGPNATEKVSAALLSYKKNRELAEIEGNKILFIDDLDAAREIIELYLKTLGFNDINSFADPNLALKELVEHPYRYFCVLSDIRMPKIDGIELLSKIRNNEKTKHIPLIFLTAVASGENFIQALKEGATGFISKPPEKKLLREEIEKAMRIFKNRQSPRLCKAEEAPLLERALRERLKVTF